MKRALVLGAGLVVRPLLDELFSRGDTEVTVAALNVDRARELVEGQAQGRARELDVADASGLRSAIEASDLVVSLLPADQHPRVAEACLDHRVPLVTSSYISDAMRELDGRARELGVLLLNETGLDPGIDHMLAAQVIQRVRREGGDIRTFASYCGGLPAPRDNDNPWGYKLSWTPRGVLISARSQVRYLDGGEVVRHPHPYAPGAGRSLDLAGVGALEVYPTRDALKYQEPYHLKELSEMYRGTLRYPGWTATLRSLLQLDLLATGAEPVAGKTYASLLEERLGAPAAGGSLRERLARRLQLAPEDDVLHRFEWLGLLSDEPLTGPPKAPLDLLAGLFQQRLQYRPGESDMVAMEHHFTASRADGSLRRIKKRLVVISPFGDRSAMARTVGTPAGLAANLILDGRLSLTGVRMPVDAQVYTPILQGLSARGFEIEEDEEDLV